MMLVGVFMKNFLLRWLNDYNKKCHFVGDIFLCKIEGARRQFFAFYCKFLSVLHF